MIGRMETDAIDLSTREGFSRALEPCWSAMSRFATRLCGVDNRDDVLQEALVTAWRKRGQFDPSRGALEKWLLAVVADHGRRFLRGSRRRASDYRHDPSSQREGLTVDEMGDLDLQGAIKMLTPRQRVAVELYYYMGYTTNEAAAIMKCSQGTVKSTLSDARTKLFNILGEDFGK